MNGEFLIGELGRAIGIDLKLSEAGTCGVFFDDDEVFFELHDGRLYLIADLGLPFYDKKILDVLK